MPRTQTNFIDFAKLASIEGSATIIGLAMVYNDLVTANWALGQFNLQKTMLPQHMHRGMRIYFSRMHNGHLTEGLRFIEKIRGNRKFRMMIPKCRPEAQHAYGELCKCIQGGADESKFGRYVTQVRHRIAFHCDDGYLRWAVKNRAAREGASTSTLTAAGSVSTNRFEFVDAILDTIVCRKIWAVTTADGASRQSELDAIGTWCDTKCIEFLKFSSDFVYVSLREFKILY